MKNIKKMQKEDPNYKPEAQTSSNADVEAEAGPIEQDDEEPEQPLMGVYMTIGLLVCITVVRHILFLACFLNRG